jgi:hypothetical protein
MNAISKMAAGALIALAATGTALAGSCPAEMKKIDEALAKSPTLTSTQMTQVKQLRADGETMHKAGKHDDSMKTLAQAKGILGIK